MIGNMGFFGFCLCVLLNWFDVMDEFVVFQGVSYFCGVVCWMFYGVLVCGFVIGIGMFEGEEFLLFCGFWIYKFSEQDCYVLIYVLLDSWLVLGVFEFCIMLGVEMVFDICVVLFLCVDMNNIGIVLLILMYWFGLIDRMWVDDYCFVVYDSDGLQMLNGSEQWLWCVLLGYLMLQILVFMDQDLLGFGLVQCVCSFDVYQDVEV